MLAILKELLQNEGYQVLCARNGIQALKLMREQTVDVILSDIKMSEMDGEEFVREVRKFNSLIPIVIVSGHSSREHLKAFVELGVDEFVEKPFDDEHILRAASRTIKIRMLRESLLGLSRLSFRAYVSIQKIESLSVSSAPVEERDREKAYLDRCMAEMRMMTNQLLESEQAINPGRFCSGYAPGVSSGS